MDILKRYRNPIVIIVVPLAASILPLVVQTKAAACAFVVILMSAYWITEALPIAITSLIPVVLFPVFGILPSSQVTVGYFKDIIMMFFGGLVAANAIEVSGLHERIALRVLMFFGNDPKWYGICKVIEPWFEENVFLRLMLGFMTITAFISLWINNTAVTSMMLPVVYAVADKLVKHDTIYHENTVNKQMRADNSLENISLENLREGKISNQDEIEENYGTGAQIVNSEKSRRLYSGFLLSNAYSANIGGLGSLVGTAPNILCKGYFDINHPQANLNFLNFFLFALPISILLVLTSWLWLCFLWLPREYWFSLKAKAQKPAEIQPDFIHNIIKVKYTKLGPMNWNQKCVGIIFFLLVTLWLTRDLHLIPGWGYFFKADFVSDTTPAILAVFLLFACPKENIFKGNKYSHLLSWSEMQNLFPWSIFLLLGSGLVLANGFKASGLSDFLAEQLKLFSNTRKELILAIVIIISASATEFTSNTSIASIFMPIVDLLARKANINPIYLLLPLTLSVSLAFCLPIATPTNAIVFASGHVKMTEMISTGFLLNIIGFLVIFLASNTWLGWIFDLSVIDLTLAYNRTLTSN